MLAFVKLLCSPLPGILLRKKPKREGYYCTKKRMLAKAKRTTPGIPTSNEEVSAT